jgi:UDP-N-acetylmuramoyl-tripeptide--D-alanyl-D-alanine ligase
VVPDALEALRGLAAAARTRSRAKVVAVTGSVGKTGTKEMLRAAFAAQGETHAAQASFNNHWGVPLTLARLPAGAKWCVVEIGMNHAGEIRPLAKLAKPDAAIITTVASVHLENFRNEAGIAFAKAEILEGLGPKGVAILNRDNAHYERLHRRAKRLGVGRVLRFGTGLRCEARLIDVAVAPGGTSVTARLNGRPIIYKIGAPGRHMAMNSLAVLLAVDAVGADPVRGAMALGAWRAPEGRGARLRVELGEAGLDGEITLIDESYNANPTSVGAALEVLAATAVEDGIGRVGRGRRIAVLGDMLELGPEEVALHAGLAEHPAMAATDRVHCCGERMRALHEALPTERRGVWAKDSAALAAQIRRLLDAGDAVMVKGSLGAKMARVVDAVKALGRVRAADAEEDG